MYIGANQFKNDNWAKTLVHEFTHFKEGKAKYNKMQSFSLSDEIKLAAGRSLSALAEEAVFDKNYGFTREEIKEIFESGEKEYSSLTKDDRAVFNEFMSEVTAHSAEAILGNESFIERVLKHDESLFKKLFDRICGIRKTLTDSGKMSSEQIKKLRK